MKNFLLYLGQPRTASTWLYGALNDRGDCDFSHIKEHFLGRDGTLNPEYNKETFFELYSGLAKNPDIKLLGEMSTTNCYLSKEQLIWLKAELNNNNFNVLPVITLRDPIDQLLSYTKLGLRIHKIQQELDGADFIQTFINVSEGKHPMPEIDLSVETIIQYHSQPGFNEAKIHWEKTFETCETIFGKLFVNFYETLHTEQSMAKLCEYLEIPPTDFHYSQIVHKMGDNIPLTNEEKQRIYDTCDDIKSNYQFAVNKFGKDFIESIWWTPNK